MKIKSNGDNIDSRTAVAIKRSNVLRGEIKTGFNCLRGVFGQSKVRNEVFLAAALSVAGYLARPRDNKTVPRYDNHLMAHYRDDVLASIP